MLTRQNDALLKGATGRHFCQFHRDAETLSQTVALFAGTGLRREMV